MAAEDGVPEGDAATPRPREDVIDDVSRGITDEDVELLRRLEGRAPDDRGQTFARRFAERHRELMNRLARDS
jgi:hypothetical protein